MTTKYQDRSLLEALIILVFKPFIYIFTHRIILLILIVGGIGLFAFNSYRASQPPPTQAQVQQSTAPSVTLAPYAVQTASRVYYAVNYKDDGKVLTLQQYYTYTKNKWQLQKGELPLDRTVYGRIEVYKR